MHNDPSFWRPPTAAPPKRINADLVALLEQKLVEARTGLLAGLGIVSVTVSGATVGIAAESRGEHGALILAGTVELQAQLRGAVFPPAQLQQQPQVFPVTRPLSS